MVNPEAIRKAYQRNQKTIRLRPEKGRGKAVTHVSLTNGTTCEVSHKHWSFKVDMVKTKAGTTRVQVPESWNAGHLAVAWRSHIHNRPQ